MTSLADLTGYSLPPVEQTYTRLDSALYAIAVGYVQDLTDPRQLSFVYEKEMRAVPTMAAVLASPGFWMKDPKFGINWQRMLHGEQGIEFHDELPVEGMMLGQAIVVDVLDRGAEKGAFVYTENRLTEKLTGKRIATLSSTAICRGDGGFGGRLEQRAKPRPMPSRPPDVTWDFQTQTQSALLYRLCGDLNPLHVDPAVAHAAGFTKPILHGLCTFGVAGHAILRTLCEYEPRRIRKVSVRFSSPVFPGDLIRTEIWNEGSQASFRCLVPNRNSVAIDNGVAEFR